MAGRDRIKLKTRAVIRRGREVLLSYAIEPGTGARFGRFLGGGIEFGEHAEATLRREIHEEIGVELGTVSLLGVIEDVCEWGGRHHHEVTFVFTATFADAEMYSRDAFTVDEDVCDGAAVWVPLERLTSGAIPMYPPELVTLLRAMPA
ncbi:MAG TPA: NUDIX domain-containing protein [Vicinamibacterales bacterium]|jgi:ADP-ribose pyrophosphatase YjhB (NUDIX family)|nr:NUDIX domain-containing protein [Vicinamibacterales bacterium]